MDDPRTQTGRSRGRPALLQRRVLLVDPDPVSRAALRALLTECGYQAVAEAATGPEAIAAAGVLTPDVVVLDTHALGRDTLQVSRAIIAERVDTKVVLVTLADPEAIRAEALAAGVVGAVAKGHPERLLAAVDQAVESLPSRLAVPAGVARCRLGA